MSYQEHRRAEADEGRDGAGQRLRARAALGIGQAADYVEVLARALRAGGITIRSGAQTVALRAAEEVELDLRAAEDGEHSTVRLELRWRTPVVAEELEIVPGVETPGTAVETGGPAGAPPAGEPPRAGSE